MTLEGTFNAARDACTFSDGSRVAFGSPVPAPGQLEQLRQQSVRITVIRNANVCMTATLAPSPGFAPEGDALTEVAIGTMLYSQRVRISTESGLPRPVKVEIACGGEIYEGQEPSLCDSCTNHDCNQLPLLQLEVVDDVSIVFQLRVGESFTPLFSCR